MKKALYYILIAIFAAVFLFSAWNIAAYYLEGKTSQDRFDDLAQQMEDAKNQTNPTVYFTQPTNPPPTTAPTQPAAPSTPTNPTTPTAETTPPVTEPAPTEPVPPVILPEYAQLYLENPDMVGWIQIENTAINYPVMQTPHEPDFYLYRNFDKKTSSRGSIYADEDCDVFGPSDNVILYGHHMYDGSMFTALIRYSSKSFYQEHPYIIFNTLLEQRTYEIIAVFKTTASIGEGFRYHTFINARNQREFDAFVNECKRLSLYRIDATAEYGDKLITLSTCEYSQTNGRLVVVAKMIKNDSAESDPGLP